MPKLILEVNQHFVEAQQVEALKACGIFVTPPLDGEYWKYRVMLYRDQAIIGFPKFATIGIGFAKEEDWNTNLPYSSTAQEIYNHIRHNKIYGQIKKADCIKAIQLIQDEVRKHVNQV